MRKEKISIYFMVCMEGESWRSTNQKNTVEKEIEQRLRVSPRSIPTSRSHIDASSIEKEPVNALGCCIVDNERLLLVGLKERRRSLSPLHAELDGLL